MSHIICPTCRSMNRLGAAFCRGCGGTLPSQPLDPGWRGTPPGLGTGRLTPQTLINGRYLINQKVGQGGMGAVYKVIDTQQGYQILALKEMSGAALTEPLEKQRMVAQFEQEAQLLQQLRHPNLPYVTDKFSVEDRHYLVMEFVNGRTLQQMLDSGQGPFPEPLVINWTQQLCSVLAYLHDQSPPIIFRDLKPDNIMVTDTNHIKLIDFGIVRFFKPGKAKDTMALGTPGYAAPEQFNGQTTVQSDVYSLGVTLFYLLTNKEPQNFPLFELPPVRQLNPTISADMESLVIQATAPQAEERLPHMRAMAASLPGQGRMAGLGQQPQPASTPPTQLEPAKRTARPTTRLVAYTARATAGLSNTQLAMAGSALLAAILFLVWIITPLVQGTWFWGHVPSITIIAPLAYAATRRRAVGGIFHALVAGVAGGLIWLRAGIDDNFLLLAIGAVLSGLAIESAFALIRRLTKDGSREDGSTWKKEMVGLGITAVLGHLILTGLVVGIAVATRPFSLLNGFLLGMGGWFIGDAIYSAWLLKKK